ncbi:hypothetical protein AAH991_38130 [Microbispora sp. ZYX-F-249]|uniref:Uncharacterized protein n=1 Tax=Microbispora maris TaxID=3144104 RepID=A0ABV0B0D6_9ACTN
MKAAEHLPKLPAWSEAKAQAELESAVSRYGEAKALASEAVKLRREGIVALYTRGA